MKNWTGPLEKIDNYRYRIPKNYKGGMRVPGIIYADGKLLENGKRSDFQVKVGDLVLFSSYGGTEIKVDDKEFLIMEESEIMAVLES